MSPRGHFLPLLACNFWSLCEFYPAFCPIHSWRLRNSWNPKVSNYIEQNHWDFCGPNFCPAKRNPPKFLGRQAEVRTNSTKHVFFRRRSSGFKHPPKSPGWVKLLMWRSSASTSWYPIVYRVLAPSSGGCEWDFWTINRSTKGETTWLVKGLKLTWRLGFPTSLRLSDTFGGEDCKG